MGDWKYVQRNKNTGQYKTTEEGGGGGGSSTLAGLDDVNISSATDGQVLKYDDATSKWVNANQSATGHTYSTTEQVVGTWIDNKPIYERVFEFNQVLDLPSNTWTDTSISNSGINRIIKATAINSSGAIFEFLGASRDSGNYIKLLQTRSSGISFNTLILQYMKSTD